MPNIVEPALISTPNSGRPAMAQVEAQRHLEAYGGGRHSVDTAYNGLRV